MKVKIKDIRTGKVKEVDQRSADILVKLKKAQYQKRKNSGNSQTNNQTPSGADNNTQGGTQTYSNRMMTSDQNND